MLSIKLDMNQLISKVRSYFSDTILKRGWSYYRGGFVRALQVESNGIITANVLGSDIYRVRLNLASFSASSCDCPYGYYCKHMAAVVFALCKEAGNDPEQFLTPGAESNASQGKAVIASANIKASLLSKPKESETPASWHRYFDNQAFPISNRDLYQLESIMQKIEHQLAVIADSWALVHRAFYRLHVQLFLMNLADSKFLSFQEDFYNYHNPKATFSRISKHCIEQILELIYELQDLQAKEQYPLHLAETADYLAEHAFPDPENSCMGWMDVYRLLWWDLLEDKELRRQEVERLHALLDAGGMASDRKDSVSMAIAHFDIVNDRDQAAMEWMERQVQDVDPGKLLGYLQTFQDLELGSRLLYWLRWLKPYVLRSGRSYIQVYLKFWANAVKIQDSQEEWRELAVGLLPESYWAYGNSLLERKYYQEWVDLCLLMEFTPLELDKSELKIIETQDLRLLLPLYHHAVERYIQEKNRDSYKRAVRMLKKLHAMYKKLKESARWEQYIGHVSKQYVRYRAFQEELRKGKLIV